MDVSEHHVAKGMISKGDADSPAAAAVAPTTTAEQPSWGNNSSDLQVSLLSIRPAQHQHNRARPMPPGTMLQLVQQQSKFLDVLQNMINTSLGVASHQEHVGSSDAGKETAAAAAAAPADVQTATASAAPVEHMQDSQQSSDSHTLKKRCLKVQKAMLRQVQAAHARAASAQMAADEACRWACCYCLLRVMCSTVDWPRHRSSTSTD
jgi:hypothetical protein